MKDRTASTENRPLPQLGMMALLFGLISLGLAAIPGVALNRPITLNIGATDQDLRIDAKPIEDPTRLFTVASICVALAGIGFSVFAYYRERIASMAACSLACCGIAITWQYIITGVAIAVAAIVILILLGLAASILS